MRHHVCFNCRAARRALITFEYLEIGDALPDQEDDLWPLIGEVISLGLGQQSGSARQVSFGQVPEWIHYSDTYALHAGSSSSHLYNCGAVVVSAR